MARGGFPLPAVTRDWGVTPIQNGLSALLLRGMHGGIVNSVGVSAAVKRLAQEPVRVNELASRISARGHLDQLALVRRRSTRTEDGPAGRVWHVELGLEFDPSALGEYWIANCHGFLVDTPAGVHVGVVDDVLVPVSSQHAAALEISVPAGLFRTHRFVLPVETVRAILPLEKRLLAETPDARDQLARR